MRLLAPLFFASLVPLLAAASPAVHPLIGKWVSRDVTGDCEVTQEFRPDGTMVQRGGRRTDTFDGKLLPADAEGYVEWRGHLRSVEGSAACPPRPGPGKEETFRALPWPRGDRLSICLDHSMEQCFPSLARAPGSPAPGAAARGFDQILVDELERGAMADKLEITQASLVGVVFGSGDNLKPVDCERRDAWKLFDAPNNVIQFVSKVLVARCVKEAARVAQLAQAGLDDPLLKALLAQTGGKYPGLLEVSRETLADGSTLTYFPIAAGMFMMPTATWVDKGRHLAIVAQASTEPICGMGAKSGWPGICAPKNLLTRIVRALAAAPAD